MADTAFQADAFQNDAFQVFLSGTATDAACSGTVTAIDASCSGSVTATDEANPG